MVETRSLNSNPMTQTIAGKSRISFLVLILVYQISFGQNISCDEIDSGLQRINTKMLSFLNGNQDSLNFYSDKFSDKLISYVKSNPASLYCKFKTLSDSNSCHIVTTPDSVFRIY